MIFGFFGAFLSHFWVIFGSGNSGFPGVPPLQGGGGGWDEVEKNENHQKSFFLYLNYHRNTYG